MDMRDDASISRLSLNAVDEVLVGPARKSQP